MGRISLMVFATICFIAAARGVNEEAKYAGISEVEDDSMESLGFRSKRHSYLGSYYPHQSFAVIEEEGLPIFVIAIIVVAALILLIICCCCCCCACCPCYHWCHPNNTNVTIIQPSTGLPGTTVENYFDRHGPSASASSQDPPPQYFQKGYGRLSTPAECV